MDTLLTSQATLRRRWSEATTVISEHELHEAEKQANSDTTDGDASLPHSDVNGNIHVVKGLTSNMPDIHIREPQTMSHEIPTSTHAHVQFRTPQKLRSVYAQSFKCMDTNIHKTLSDSFLSDRSDWMLAERSHSRSPPSPAVTCRSPAPASRSPCLRQSPSVPTSGTMFNFSPERTEVYLDTIEAESQRIRKRLFEEDRLAETTNERLSSEAILRSPSYRHLLSRPPLVSQQHSPRDLNPRDVTRSRDVISRDQHETEPETQFYLSSPCSPSFRNKLYNLSSEREQVRAKRRLDDDEEYIASPKRVKIDLEREMGYRYIQQLESDITNIRRTLAIPETDGARATGSRPSCTCAIMERQFLEMAESAYRSVRRTDASPRGFEQFRQELIQTNQVMKDSMEVLRNIRRVCDH